MLVMSVSRHSFVYSYLKIARLRIWHEPVVARELLPYTSKISAEQVRKT